jgi:hypothetical protein
MSDKKLFQISTYTEADWEYVHNILTADGSIDDNIPAARIECTDTIDHSPTRAVYLLSEDEARQLSQCPKVRALSLDFASYPDQFKVPPEELYATPRYSSAVKNYRNFADTNTLPASPGVADLNRSGYQLLRSAQKNDPWYGISDTTVINDQINYVGDGTDVDVIVGDDGCWFGHVEFQNNATGGGPTNYVGGNKLPGNGTCDLLDLVLEGPYYIDPAWFNADAATRLTTRWDGTTVPVEAVARTWWGNAAQRSVAFAGIGTVTVTSNYTRAYNNGDNVNISTVGQHGTCCASITYGRTQGWAYNANKWFIQVYNTNGSDVQQYFDIMKIFHLNKPINPTYGTRNPTISSNSWGYRAIPPSSGYYYFRGDTVGVSYGSGTKPEFMKYVGLYGDGGRMKGQMLDNAYTIAGEEMINAGVIFVGAAGNGNQKQVGPAHPDFNNFYNSGPNQTVTTNSWFEFGVRVYPYTNRRGFPQHIGKTAGYVYPVINIGALDDSYQPSGKERKVNYSDMGPEIDCFAPADGTLGANHSYSVAGNRADTYALAAAGFSGIYSASAALTRTGTFVVTANAGNRLSTSGGAVTITSITNTLVGAGALTSSTTPTTGDNDDGYWSLTLPFSISFNGATYTAIGIGTNSYITFGGGSTAFSALGAANPFLPKIMICSADVSAQRIYYGVSGTTPNRTYRVRWEGTNFTSGTLGSPNMVWEATFYEATPAQIDIQIGANANGTRTFSDAKFSGTSAACPAATGLIATVLQYNRSWTWSDVRNWLQNSVEVQDTAKFYVGTESTTANAATWSDVVGLEGAAPRVIYNAFSIPISNPITKSVKMKGNFKLKGNISIKFKN